LKKEKNRLDGEIMHINGNSNVGEKNSSKYHNKVKPTMMIFSGLPFNVSLKEH
jgi:hypothetical protein